MADTEQRRSARCSVCGRKVRFTKIKTLANHRNEWGHPCPNSGSEKP